MDTAAFQTTCPPGNLLQLYFIGLKDVRHPFANRKLFFTHTYSLTQSFKLELSGI